MSQRKLKVDWVWISPGGVRYRVAYAAINGVYRRINKRCLLKLFEERVLTEPSVKHPLLLEDQGSTLRQTDVQGVLKR